MFHVGEIILHFRGPKTCQYVFWWPWRCNDQNVLFGQYSMIYYLSNVWVFCFPRSWWGWWLAGVIKCLNLCYINVISIMLTTKSFLLYCWSVLEELPQSVCGHVSTVLLCLSMWHALQALSLSKLHSPEPGFPGGECHWKFFFFFLCYFFPCYLTNSVVIKVQANLKYHSRQAKANASSS